MKSYKEILEALKGKQHKIDKNKNGKIDAHDFKLLRKEESEELSEATVKTDKYSWGTMKTVHHGKDFSIPLHPEHHHAIAKLKDEQEHKFKDETGRHWTARRKGEDVHFHSGNDGPKTKVKHADLKEETEIDEAADRMARADYKVSPSGRKSHKEIVFPSSDKKDDKEEMKEQAPVAPGLMKHRISVTVSDPDHPMVSKRKEKIQKTVIVTHSDNKEGARRVGEKFYAKKGLRVHDSHHAGVVNEETDKKKEDDLPFTPDKPKKNPIAKAGKFGIGPSTAKHLAKMGMKKVMKEEDDASEKMEMAQTQLHFIKYAAEEILEYIDMGGKIEEWYQNKLSKVQSEVESLHSYIEGESRRTGMKEEVEELDERNKQNATMRKMMDASRGARFKAQGNYTPDPEPQHKTAQAHNKAVGRAIRQMSREEVELEEKMDMKKADMGDVIKDFQKSDAPQFAGKSKEKRREMAIAAKLEADRGTRKEETEVLSYKQFMTALDEIKMADLPSRKVTGRGYGTEYYKKEAEKDEQGFDAKDDNQSQKRGRGRPAGAKSGARGPRIK